MTDFAIELFLSIWRGLGICALCALSYGVLKRAMPEGSGQSLGIGAIFGLGAVSAMLSPAYLQPGMLLDARGFLVGFAAGFGGWPAALVAVALAIPCRVAIGGAGLLVGVVGILIAGLMGLLWRRGRGGDLSENVGLRSLAGLGVMISGHLASFALSPAEGAVGSALGLLVLVAPLYAAGAVAFGAMLSRERYLAVFGRSLPHGPQPPAAPESQAVRRPTDAAHRLGAGPPGEETPWHDDGRASRFRRMRHARIEAWPDQPRLVKA